MFGAVCSHKFVRDSLPELFYYQLAWLRPYSIDPDKTLSKLFGYTSILYEEVFILMVINVHGWFSKNIISIDEIKVYKRASSDSLKNFYFKMFSLLKTLQVGGLKSIPKTIWDIYEYFTPASFPAIQFGVEKESLNDPANPVCCNLISCKYSAIRHLIQSKEKRITVCFKSSLFDNPQSFPI